MCRPWHRVVERDKIKDTIYQDKITETAWESRPQSRFHQPIPSNISNPPSYDEQVSVLSLSVRRGGLQGFGLNSSLFIYTELSQSPMLFSLGSIIVKGGKILSSGYNHQRTHYDETYTRPHGKPVSMHAEMHAIFNITGGRSPPIKQQVQAGSPPKRQRQQGGTPKAPGSKATLSGLSQQHLSRDCIQHTELRCRRQDNLFLPSDPWSIAGRIN